MLNFSANKKLTVSWEAFSRSWDPFCISISKLKASLFSVSSHLVSPDLKLCF
jgi:hypothetical protein